MAEIEKIKRADRTAGLAHETQVTQDDGCLNVIGFDEAGRGAWAGPMMVGAVCLPLDNPALLTLLHGVRDSKQMTPRQRTALEGRIQETAITWGVGSVTPAEIDGLGINAATYLAMQRALTALIDHKPGFAPHCLLMDSISWPNAPVECLKYSIKKGDQFSLTIAAASVLAKVARDRYMHTLETQYPEYAFATHKGYGTRRHRDALEAHGVLPIHRTYYAPIRALLKESSA